MQFYEEKIVITRKELLKLNFNSLEKITNSEITEKPIENILCQMIKNVIDNKEVA